MVQVEPEGLHLCCDPDGSEVSGVIAMEAAQLWNESDDNFQVGIQNVFSLFS